MRFLSVCSGIEAASVAWNPLGWHAIGFSEIEAFPNAVLTHHYPTVPNFGDMTRFQEWPDAACDVLVGGTPCQSFSIAGLRAGLDDPRGNLMLTFAAVARRYRPAWVVWENVPGVLSSDGGRDLAAFLWLMGECGYYGAWRVLDAQYFGVPQRRRRVFFVGHSRDWRRAAAVLFERESLRWNPAPRRETGEGIAPTISARTKGGGGLGTDFDCDGGLIANTLHASDALHAVRRDADNLIPERARALTSSNQRIDAETETLICHSLRADGFDASEDGTGRGTPLVAFSCKDHGADCGDTAPTLRAMGHDGSHANAGGQIAIAFNLRGREGGAMPEQDDLAALRSASGGSSRSYIAQSSVRRLTPRECERLQGFPDDYTLIPYRGKAAADGPRYKALGNSMAVPVIRWIGERIAMVDAIRERAAA